MSNALRPGPRAREQLARVALSWPQGDHVLVTGGTGGGKTVLARALDQIRIDRGGSVVVFLAKMAPDETITRDYRGFKRWTTWHKHPSVNEQKILFWPKVEGKSTDEARVIFRREYQKALNEISRVGRWTVHVDEGLFVCDPSYLGLGSTLGMMYALMRSSKGTLITLAQRPAHLPVAIYPNLSHAFIARASELPDLRRLANLDGATNSRVLQKEISNLRKYDFLWISTGTDRTPERFNFLE